MKLFSSRSHTKNHRQPHGIKYWPAAPQTQCVFNGSGKRTLRQSHAIQIPQDLRDKRGQLFREPVAILRQPSRNVPSQVHLFEPRPECGSRQEVFCDKATQRLSNSAFIFWDDGTIFYTTA